MFLNNPIEESGDIRGRTKHVAAAAPPRLASIYVAAAASPRLSTPRAIRVAAAAPPSPMEYPRGSRGVAATLDSTECPLVRGDAADVSAGRRDAARLH